MRKQIRKGVFETNSSSTHVISICKRPSFVLMENQKEQTIEFNGGEFGWQFDLYADLQTKADYLWTGIVEYYDDHDAIQKIQKNIEVLLSRYNINAEFQPYEIRRYSNGGGEYCSLTTFSYVDHSACLREFMDAMFPNNGEDIDEELFLSYLFNDSSYIETGNDNDDGPDFNYPDQSIGEIVEFYKGN